MLEVPFNSLVVIAAEAVANWPDSLRPLLNPNDFSEIDTNPFNESPVCSSLDASALVPVRNF